MTKYITVVKKNGKRYKLSKDEFVRYIINVNKTYKAIAQAKADYIAERSTNNV